MSAFLTLRQGDAVLSLLPDLGGAIARFAVAGREVLRPTPAGVTNPLETACFPLVPYANRIAGGAFRFEGRDYALPTNFPGFEHPLHGIGWLRPWTVESAAADTAVLTCSHAADDAWPWDWSASQRFVLEDSSVMVELELVNRSDRAMPAGIGLHPYFARDARDLLAFEAQGVWRNDDTMIPTEAAPAATFGDFAVGAVPEGDLIDNCYFGWAGSATLGGARDRNVELKASLASYLHVYAPPGEPFLCLEPTSQMPDALNQPDFGTAGGTVLAPGGKTRLAMTISVA